MYGLVNKAVKGFAIEVGGEQAWTEISTKAKSESEFLAMHPYPDELTFALVEAAAEYFELSPEEVLRGFGRHWILFTAEAGYGEMLDLYGNDLEEFILNLDDMHTRLRISMPNLNMPSFSCQRSDDGDLVVDYYSERQGLEAMVVGLLEGLGERFNQPVSVARADAPKNVNARFLVRSVGIDRDVA